MSRARAAATAALLAVVACAAACSDLDGAFDRCVEEGRCRAGSGTGSDGGDALDASVGDAGSGDAGTDGGPTSDAGTPPDGDETVCVHWRAPSDLRACQESPYPVGETISDLWISPSGTVWMAGYGGMIVTSLPDGGWTARETAFTGDDPAGGPGTTFNAIAGRGDDDVFVVGSGGANGVLHFTDGGVQSATPEMGVNLWYSAACGTDRCWIAAYNDSVYRWTGTWKLDVALPPVHAAKGLWATPDGDLWLASGPNVQRRTGSGWELVGPSLLGTGWVESVSGTSDHDLYAVGDTNNASPTLPHLTDAGWIDEPIPATTYHDVFATSGDVRACGDQGSVLRRENGQWKETTLGSETLRAVAISPTTGAWVAGDLGRLFHDDGQGYVDVSPAPRIDVESISATDPSNAWSAGSLQKQTAVMRRIGPHWEDVTPPQPKGVQWHGVFTFGPNDTWAVGSAGSVAHFTGVWSDESMKLPPTSADLFGVWGAAPDDLWVVGSAGTIFHFDGTAWTKVKSPTTLDLMTIDGASAENVWAAGRGGALLRGPVWTTVRYPGNTSDTLPTVSGLSVIPGAVWISSTEGLFRLDAEGWTSVASAADGSDVLALEDGRVFATGQKASILEYDAAAKAFIPHTWHNGWPVLTLARASDGGFFAGGGYGTVVRIRK